MGSTGNDVHTNPSTSLKADDEIFSSADAGGASVINVTTRERAEFLLPPLEEEHVNRKTLVLDLDETLVHASLLPLPHYDFLLEFPADDVYDAAVMYMLKRPGVDEFLKEAAKLFEVVVFTAACQSYADPVLDQLDVNRELISHRLYHHQCRRIVSFSPEDNEGVVTVKDLSRLGRDISKTIIVDDSPVAYSLQPENAVRIDSYFEHRPDDRELRRVMSILRIVVEVKQDVRDFLAEQLELQLNELQ